MHDSRISMTTSTVWPLSVKSANAFDMVPLSKSMYFSTAPVRECFPSFATSLPPGIRLCSRWRSRALCSGRSRQYYGRDCSYVSFENIHIYIYIYIIIIIIGKILINNELISNIKALILKYLNWSWSGQLRYSFDVNWFSLYLNSKTLKL